MIKEPSMVDRKEMIAVLEAIVMVTGSRSARAERSRAIAGQIARTALADLRRPRLVERSTPIKEASP